jgi:hypothetical protein
VETLVTWREIAQTDSVAQIGAMDLLLLEEVLADLLAVLQLAELALAMQLIVNTSNSCKNCPVALLHQMARHLNVSKLAQVVMTKGLLLMPVM